MTKGELDNAKRRALNLLDAWLAVTGALTPHTSTYYELQGIVEDAVEAGAQAALRDFRPFDGEADASLFTPAPVPNLDDLRAPRKVRKPDSFT